MSCEMSIWGGTCWDMEKNTTEISWVIFFILSNQQFISTSNKFAREFSHETLICLISDHPNCTSMFALFGFVLKLSLLTFCHSKMQIRNFQEGGMEAPTDEELTNRNDMGPGKHRKFREEGNVLLLVSFES